MDSNFNGAISSSQAPMPSSFPASGDIIADSLDTLAADATTKLAATTGSDSVPAIPASDSSLSSSAAMSAPTSMGSFREHQLHASPILSMKLNSSGTRLFTCCSDGIIISCNVTYFNKCGNKLTPIQPSVIQSSQIGGPGAGIGGQHIAAKGDLAFGSSLAMVYRTALDEFERTIKDLNYRIHEIKQESAMQAMFKEQSNAEVVSKLKEEVMSWQEKHDKSMKEANTKMNIMEVDYGEKIRAIELANIKRIEDLETNYERRLAVHQGAHAFVQEQLADATLKFEEREHHLTTENDKKVSELIRQSSHQRQEAQRVLEEEVEKHDNESKEAAALLYETERDGDEEIELVHATMSNQIKEREESISVLKAENYLLRSAMDRQLDECKQLRERQKGDAEEIGDLKSMGDKLNFTVNNLMKEVQQRDEANNTKEDVITTLRAENRQLMKIKFILNYKFEELKQQVEPREIKLREMQVQLSGQDDALNDQLKEMDLMKNSILDKESKMKGMDR